MVKRHCYEMCGLWNFDIFMSPFLNIFLCNMGYQQFWKRLLEHLFLECIITSAFIFLSLSVSLFNILRVYFVDILLINYSSLSSYMRLPICIFFFFVSATTPVLFSFLIPAILSVCSFVLLKICILCCYNCSVMTHY